MHKFSFSEEKDILIPNSPMFRPPLDAKGQALSGDDLMRMFGKVITQFEKKHNRPVPVQDQKFINWIKQFNRELAAGKTSDEIMKRTLVRQ